jgi:hypothetical protein
MHVIYGFIFIILAFGSNALAMKSDVEGTPNLFKDDPSLTIGHSVLGRACYSMQASYLDIDCNPAFLANQNKQIFRINLYGNDALGPLNKSYNEIKDHDRVSVAERLLNEKSMVIAKASSAIWYQQDWWAIGYVPVRAGAAYMSRNPSYPEEAVHAYKEYELFSKIGLFVSDNHNFQVGFQTRYLHRDYIYQKFYAFDALTDPNVIKIRHQTSFFLEPGLTYSWESEWQPMFAATVTNTPIYVEGDHLPFQPIIDMGVSARFPTWTQFRSSLHYTSGRPGYTELYQRFSWSGVYDFNDVASTYITLGTNQFGLGIDGHWGPIVTGLSYKTEKITLDNWTTTTVSRFTLELGLTF